MDFQFRLILYQNSSEQETYIYKYLTSKGASPQLAHQHHVSEEKREPMKTLISIRKV